MGSMLDASKRYHEISQVHDLASTFAMVLNFGSLFLQG